MVLPVPGTTRDHDVGLALHAGVEQLPDLGREGPEVDQVLEGERVGLELTDREERAPDAQGRENGVDTGAVSQPGVHHGRGLVDVAAHLADDPGDHMAEVGLIDES